MEQSTAPTAVVAQPKTIVIERRWAIVGGAVIAALIIGLGVALAFSAGDDHGPGGPPGFQLSAEGAQGYGPGFAPPGTQQMPQGAPVPQAPDGAYPPGGGTYGYPPEAVPAPPGAQNQGGTPAPNSQGGNGSGSNN